jgi:hypothetical protein
MCSRRRGWRGVEGRRRGRCHSSQPLVEDSSQERFLHVEVRRLQSEHDISYVEKSVLGSVPVTRRLRRRASARPALSSISSKSAPRVQSPLVRPGPIRRRRSPQFCGDRVRNQNIRVQALKDLSLFEKDQVVQRTTVRDNDHQSRRIPTSRWAARSSSKSASL